MNLPEFELTTTCSPAEVARRVGLLISGEAAFEPGYPPRRVTGRVDGNSIYLAVFDARSWPQRKSWSWNITFYADVKPAGGGCRLRGTFGVPDQHALDVFLVGIAVVLLFAAIIAMATAQEIGAMDALGWAVFVGVGWVILGLLRRSGLRTARQDAERLETTLRRITMA